MSKEIGFFFFLFYDDLETQANKQGYTLGDQSELMEKLRFSANMVRMHGLVTDSQADGIYKKLQKKVVKALKPKVLSDITNRENDHSEDMER